MAEYDAKNPERDGRGRRRRSTTTRSSPRSARATAPDVVELVHVVERRPLLLVRRLDRPRPATSRRTRSTRASSRPRRSTTRSTRARGARCRCSPTCTASTTTRRCSRRRASTGPPKTLSELTAYAKKLTVRKSDGSLKVVGLRPGVRLLPEQLGRLSSRRSERSGSTRTGKSSLSTDPAWSRCFSWQKSLVDYYGHDKLVKWQTGAGDEFSASHAFETGKLAMMMDGEWRVSFIAAEHPELPYGTAPMPVDERQAEPLRLVATSTARSSGSRRTGRTVTTRGSSSST